MQRILPVVVSALIAIPSLVSAQAPDENRFEKVILTEGLNEPLEMAILPDERVVVIERHGLIKLYDPKTKKMSVIATIPVSTKYNPDAKGVQAEAEDGLLGITLDPAFATNGFIYLYYSPAGKTPVNVLARYKMAGSKIDLASKKVILEVPVQRDECCHTGGSMDWDANGNLYLSTGDNTSPRASDGYAPIDERAGRTPFDAQRSSGNTNDLRGKVLRVHPEANGTYTIPDGNLFPKGTELTKPEIYTMGHRNPYRISVDKHTGWLFWGDVGPDSGRDSTGLGPTAEDEFNVARAPGNFGWPYFVGDNKAYWDFDFETKRSGEKFVADKPINSSPNNTGLKELPPAQKAFIWYTAGSSNRFPLVGSGGRSAMSGPVYHTDDFTTAKRAFPDYYNNKWFIYEWMRDWIIVVTMNDKGNYSRMERFLPNLKLDHPIDMAFGPNGDLYVLEYGQGWFMENPESKLVRIEYNGGNRKPVVVASASKSAGAVPFTVNLSSEGTKDYDNDNLTYEWKITNAAGAAVATLKDPNASYDFKAAGNYKVKLTVTDAQGSSDSKELTVSAGNEPPVVSLSLAGNNQSFFFPNQKIAYEVKVSDKEDGSLEDKKILPSSVRITATYQDGDGTAPAAGHQEAPVTFVAGKNIIAKSDCKACHFEDKKSIGPSFLDIATKYKQTAANITLLSDKVIKGGSGVWGDVAMAPHPDIGLPEAKQIVQYILSLSNVKKAEPTLPVKGELTVKVPEGVDPTKGVYRISASYKDKGFNGVKAITSEQTITLRSPTVLFGNADDSSPNIMKFKMGDANLLIVTAANTYASFKKIDMTGIKSLYLTVTAPVEQLNASGGIIEVHTGAVDGPLIGQSEFIPPSNEPIALMSKSMPAPHRVAVSSTGVQDLYFVFKNDKATGALYIPLSVTFSAE
ncbi:MAG TPA: PQQ-dependent sugar dehydrogenase [Cyclobacteriaceae bacterium]|nr:PQQ-dependent sugar dehydrogenase [Cyclobacteriaceae bacterium]